MNELVLLQATKLLETIAENLENLVNELLNSACEENECACKWKV